MLKVFGLVWFLVLASAAHAADLVVTVTDEGVSVPASVESGYTNFVLDNRASITFAHEIVRLKEGDDPEFFREGIAAFFSGTADEETVGRLMNGFDTFLGGAVGTPAGSSRSVGMVLTPGNYVVYADGLPNDGEMFLDVAHTAVIKVTEAANPASEPEADFEIKMAEYAFALPANLAAGTYLVRFENVGHEDHLGFVFKLPDDMTPEEAKGISEGEVATDWATTQGVHALGHGAVNYVELTFEPGATYLFDCPIPNEEGVPHDHLGMQQFVTIPSN